MSYTTLSQLYHEELYHYQTEVIVVLPRSWESYSPEEHLLLQKILTSVKMNLSGVQMLILPRFSLKALAVFAPQCVLIFGAETEEEMPFYQRTPAQGFTVIKADALEVLDDSKKKNLWTALRQMFGI